MSAWATATAGLREPTYGYERLVAEDHRPRHRHGSAYATVVLSGVFMQTGYTGRYRAEAGDVLIQPTFDRHADRMISAGIHILRLPWRFDAGAGGVWRGGDIDEIRRLSNASVRDAALQLEAYLHVAQRLSPVIEHRPDRFFADITADPDLNAHAWADRHSLRQETLCRGLQRLYGVAPAALRGELRARAALRLCTQGSDPLSRVAQDAGYADQPHMTRALRDLTGITPARWRASLDHLTGAR